MSNLNTEEQKVEKEVVSVNKLLEAGVYFGHKKDRWNPKMKPFIHGVKNGTHIINVSKTHKALELAFKLISKAAEKGSTFIFVGTKKQARDVSPNTDSTGHSVSSRSHSGRKMLCVWGESHLICQIESNSLQSRWCVIYSSVLYSSM